jgi:hypothetical protein
MQESDKTPTLKDERFIYRDKMLQWLKTNVNEQCTLYTKVRQDIENKKIVSLSPIDIPVLTKEEKGLLAYRNFYCILFTRWEFNRKWPPEDFRTSKKAFYEYAEWNYETCRLRFFIEAIEDSPIGGYRYPEIQRVGEQLLARAPNDYWVKVQLIQAYFHFLPSENAERRMILCQEILKQRPDRLQTMTSVGGEYHTRWYFMGRKKEDGLQAIKYYQMALPKMSQDTKRRFTNRINEIESKLDTPKVKARWPGD